LKSKIAFGYRLVNRVAKNATTLITANAIHGNVAVLSSG
jgi:hypothetical protein